VFLAWCDVVVVFAFYMCFRRDGGRHVSVGMWCFGVGWLVGDDGWVCPNGFCLLGCRFDMPCGMSDGVLCAIYMLLVGDVRVIFVCHNQIYILIRRVLVVIY